MMPAQSTSPPVVPAPSNDKRWRIVGATMRRHGYKASALIETLSTVQNCFGYVDESSLVYVARSLKVPLSKAYGVATFYSVFLLKPRGRHACIVCTGTACYIKGATKVLSAVERLTGVRPDETSFDNNVSLVAARCFGACGIAPAAIFDGQVVGELSPEQTETRIKAWLKRQS